MALRVEMKGAAEARALLVHLEGRELQNRTRRGLRSGAKVFRTAYRSEVRGRSDLPRSFAKTDTRNHRSPLGVSTGPKSPLINIFEEGAGVHRIAPGWSGTSEGNATRRSRAGTFTGRMLLAGRAGQRWRGRAFLASEPVTHPGMSARPSIGPVFDRENDHASEAAMAKILEGLE